MLGRTGREASENHSKSSVAAPDSRPFGFDRDGAGSHPMRRQGANARRAAADGNGLAEKSSA